MEPLYKQKFHEYIQSNKDEIINVVKELVKIPSVRGEAETAAPFGKACAEILEYTKHLYDKNGFETELDNEGGYLLSYYGSGEKGLGLFAHADVVTAGDDWIYTEPFTPIEKDGFLIGRGVLDDKSAIVISLYCAKMLKELYIPFNSKLVCYTGANEESGMHDIHNYLKKHQAPDFSLVCDTAFPLYIGNKGLLQIIATSKIPLTDIKDFCGGKTFNVNLGKATVKIEYTKELYDNLKEKETERIKISVENDEIIINTEGISRHGALPEGSLNAGFIATKLLSKCESLSENDRKQMKFTSELLSHYYGEALNIENTDPNFGKLTCTNGIIKMNNGKLSLYFDIRFGECVNIEKLKYKIATVFGDNAWIVDFCRTEKAHLIKESNPYIQTCLNVFKNFTSKEDAKLYVNAGGTYARYLPCAAEIGTAHGSSLRLPEGHGNVHQPDECISIDGMLEAIELTILMLIALDNMEEY